jgi:hypothetical protein
MFVDTDADTASRLEALRGAAAALSSSGPVLRARLRCAVADTALRVDSTPDEVEAVYGPLVEDAIAGRLLQAGRLAGSSRPALRMRSRRTAAYQWHQQVRDRIAVPRRLQRHLVIGP